MPLFLTPTELNEIRVILLFLPGDPIGEKVWLRSWKCCPRLQAKSIIVAFEVSVLSLNINRLKPAGKLSKFISYSLSNNFYKLIKMCA